MGSWLLRDRSFELDRQPRIMGIVNVTPDSFSDGGRFFDSAAAVAHGMEMIRDGADILDIGGESTRPGAEPVSAADELRRVLPVIEQLRRISDVPISIDTSKADVADAALAAGADIVNDVTAGRDPDMAGVVAFRQAGIVLMHMRGTPQTMQDDPRYGDVVGEVTAELNERIETFRAAGVAAERIVIDPGIGFGKTFEHNMELLVRLPELLSLGRPICLGVSRKGFIGQIIDRPRDERAVGSAAIGAYALTRRCVHVLRVHDVPATRDVTRMVGALRDYPKRGQTPSGKGSDPFSDRL